MISVTFEGFKSIKDAEIFVQWYEGQGEQDAEIWFECNDSTAPMVDCNKAYVKTNNNITAQLKY